MSLFDPNRDFAFNVGRLFAYGCAFVGHHLSLWPLVIYFVLVGGIVGLAIFIAGMPEALIVKLIMAFFLAILPIAMVVRNSRLWCRVPTRSNLISLWRHNSVF
jgi:hypothetical protein